MALAKRLKELLEALEMDLETYLKKHYELFEAVDTGYVAKDGRTHFTELIYHGHSRHVCRYCQRALRQTPACAARFRGALAAPYPVYRCPYPFTCV